MRGQPIIFDDFRGGENQSAAPYSLDLNQARQVLNVTGTSIGSVRKRYGFDAIGTASKPLNSLGTFHGGTDYLVAVGDDGAATDLYRITTGGTITSIKGALTLSLSKPWSFAQAPADGGQGPLWAMNGTDTPLQWTGTGNATAWTANAGSLPNGKFILYVGNRMLITGDPANPSKLYASGIGDPRDHASPSAVTTTFDPDDGEDITGIGQVGSYVLIFKPRKTYVVYDLNTLAYRLISSEVGCVAHRSITETDGGTFFLSNEQGVMSTNGESIDPIGINVEPATNDIAGGSIYKAAAVYKDYKYYLSIDRTGVNSEILEYDTRLGSWWTHKVQLDASTTGGVCDWAILNPESDSRLYAGSATAAFPIVFEAFKEGSYTDNDLPYVSYWITQWHTFKLPHIRKVFRQFRMDAAGQFRLYFAKSFANLFSTTESIIWEIAEGDDGAIFGGDGNFGGTGIFGGEVLVQEHRAYTPGTARAMSLKFQAESAGPWELYSYSIMVESRKD